MTPNKAIVDSRYDCVPERVSVGRTGVTDRHVDDREGDERRMVLALPDGTQVRLDRDLRIGQSSKNDVTVRDPRISREHCAIELLGRRVILRDLDSTNGTFVNGTRVSSAELLPGALIALGTTRLHVFEEGADAEDAILGESQAVKTMKREIAKLAPARLPVLIHGETGSGKELVALALHRLSGRRGGFVPLNCGSIARELVESELFGHERGAFTGAQTRRQGVFEEAHGGTLFLDEVGELPLALQTRLLRVLETGVVRPVGSSREVAVDVRVVAATHVDLKAAVVEGRFRQDLYYRLVSAVIATPPLRARREDVALLARRFLDELSAEGRACRLSDAALAKLLAHDWPGNVRELRNVLRRAAVLGGPVIGPEDLALDVAPARFDHEVVRIDRPYLEIEKEILRRAIQRARGSRRAAAHALQIPKSTLCDKAKRYGLDYDEEEVA